MRGPETLFELAQKTLGKKLMLVGEPIRKTTPDGIALTVPQFSICEYVLGEGLRGKPLAKGSGPTAEHALRNALARYHNDPSIKHLPLAKNPDMMDETMEGMQSWIMYKGEVHFKDSGLNTTVGLVEKTKVKAKPHDENFITSTKSSEWKSVSNFEDAVLAGFSERIAIPDRFKRGEAESWLEPEAISSAPQEPKKQTVSKKVLERQLSEKQIEILRKKSKTPFPNLRES